jgi:hypothetical protein
MPYFAGMDMRNLLPLVLFLLLNSCSTSEHLQFNTVVMDGPVAKFAGELTKQGFILSDSAKTGEIVLLGEFLNKECRIGVFGTGKDHITYKIVVQFPGEVSDSLQHHFGKLQQLYTSKYGNGTSRYQKYKKRDRLLFNEPGLTREIRVGDFTKYTTPAGDITIEVKEGYISITYLDKQNNEMRVRETEEKSPKEHLSS